MASHLILGILPKIIQSCSQFAELSNTHTHTQTEQVKALLLLRVIVFLGPGGYHTPCLKGVLCRRHVNNKSICSGLEKHVWLVVFLILPSAVLSEFSDPLRRGVNVLILHEIKKVKHCSLQQESNRCRLTVCFWLRHFGQLLLYYLFK